MMMQPTMITWRKKLQNAGSSSCCLQRSVISTNPTINKIQPTRLCPSMPLVHIDVSCMSKENTMNSVGNPISPPHKQIEYYRQPLRYGRWSHHIRRDLHESISNAKGASVEEQYKYNALFC